MLQLGFLLRQFIVMIMLTIHGCAKGQGFNCWLFTEQIWVCTQCSSCGICGGQNGTGTGFFSQSFGLPVIIIPLLLHIHSYIIWGMENGLIRSSF